MTEETPGRLNMDEIVRVIVHDHGIYAYVEQTGGGCATIYAGARDKEGYFQAVAGPGHYSWDAKIPSTGHVDEFYISPDDMGDTPAADAKEMGATTEAAIAEIIVRLVRTGSVQPATYLDDLNHVWDIDPAAHDDAMGVLTALLERTLSAADKDLILRGTRGLLDRKKGTFAQCLDTSMIWLFG